MKRLSFIYVFSLLYLCLFGQSIAISIPYSCGFEDSTEIACWNINTGPDGVNCQDRWMIGNLEYSEGYNSMYISCDTGKTTNYGAKPTMVIAYRALEIPSLLDTSKTSYSLDVSFDWKCVGEDKLSTLKFYLLPGNFISEQELASASATADLPNKLSRAMPVATLYGSQDWQNWMSPRPTTVKVDTKFLLVFIWQNSNTDTAKFCPQAAVVDNIQITSSNCWKPENLQTSATCDSLFVTWEGANESYEFQYRPSDAKVWRGTTITKDKHMLIPNVSEGSYDVRIRGLCGDEKSAWVTKNGAICFCPDRHCINYVNLDRAGVICEQGKATDPTKGVSLSSTGLGTTGSGPIDYGSNDKRSRHTVNWKQGEYDPRTGNKLRTIPNGALASVRLGNWDVNKQAEGINFEYYVDTTQAFILLMKYAIVLEAPGHGIKADPYFKLEIIDEDGVVIDPNCGEFEFTPENENIQWYKHGAYVWKDWTSIGLNLGDYHGELITIRLITQDCTQSAHAGYAYFTLDCADAAIKSTSCGETVEMEMVAPDGFRYIWTKAENRDSVISTEKSINVPANDTTTYYCDIDYIDMEGCGFTLFTSVFPRYPHAEYIWKWVPVDCENRIELTNKSCVFTKVEDTETSTSEECETFHWIINNGEYETATKDLTYTVPREGDTLTVTLVAGISDDACQDDTTFTFIVPPIHEHHDTIREVLCEGNVRHFDDKLLAVSGIYTEFKKNIWGCDSITVLDLTFRSQPDDVVLYDTICSNELYPFKDETLNESGDYRAIFTTDYGCDSVVVLHLYVVEAIDVVVEDKYRFICSEDNELHIDYKLVENRRGPNKYSIIFDNLAQQCGFVDIQDQIVNSDNKFIISIPDKCRPNHYTATILVEDEALVCQDKVIPIEFDVYYSSSILYSKFNNLLTLYNEEYNGGYTFLSYQWYKNDKLLEGEINSFLYLKSGEVFAEDDCYYLSLIRADDGVQMRTCEICPGVGTDIDDVMINDLLLPTVFKQGQRVVFDDFGNGVVNVYSLSGQLINHFNILDLETEIVMPQHSGFYLLQIVTSEFNQIYKIQVKE